ncbi:MAG: chloride channel protein [Actinomycetota bacterium]|nr:chloride channel protein [Actinomycetota bacterium]
MVFLISWLAARRKVVIVVVLTGLSAGLGGIALTWVLHLTQHLAFGYVEESFLPGVEQASPAHRIAALVVGGLLVGLGWWALERWARSEDVSVKAALAGDTPRLRVRASVFDAVLQVVGVGAGASLGREGAPRQVGAALAGWLGERLDMDEGTRRTLMAAGAGAGLAAVYNVPISGVIFTLEVLLASWAWRNVLLAAATSLIATVITWPILGTHSAYDVQGLHLDLSVLVWVLLAGPVLGAGGVVFTALMRVARGRIPSGRTRVVTTVGAFLLLGGLAAFYPQVLGNGKGPTQVAFTGSISLMLATVLVVLKPVATALCLAGGARGGLLTPSLSTGALLGVATGVIWQHLWPGAPVVDFAVIGAASMLAVTQRAPVLGTVLTLEFIGGGLTLLPALLICVMLATLTARALDGRSPRVAGISGLRV